MKQTGMRRLLDDLKPFSPLSLLTSSCFVSQLFLFVHVLFEPPSHFYSSCCTFLPLAPLISLVESLVYLLWHFTPPLLLLLLFFGGVVSWNGVSSLVSDFPHSLVKCSFATDPSQADFLFVLSCSSLLSVYCTVSIGSR